MVQGQGEGGQRTDRTQKEEERASGEGAFQADMHGTGTAADAPVRTGRPCWSWERRESGDRGDTPAPGVPGPAGPAWAASAFRPSGVNALPNVFFVRARPPRRSGALGSMPRGVTVRSGTFFYQI